ncbi:hypothetical protein Hdeb2414_s0008g00297931 [Helianthus debilis subsp. tardiflorus]
MESSYRYLTTMTNLRIKQLMLFIKRSLITCDFLLYSCISIILCTLYHFR